MQAFQSTFPQGERLRPQGPLQQGTLRFNPRSRKGNDFLPSGGADRLNLFQSTFPQGERLLDVNRYDIANLVSIHVPARGTTGFPSRSFLSVHGFNPRSRKGNDAHPKSIITLFFGFNPRSRKGNDMCHMQSKAHTMGFNPRSRKGNDAKNLEKTAKKIGFNPRSRKGNDDSYGMDGNSFAEFQSTFPQGERHKDRLHRCK